MNNQPNTSYDVRIYKIRYVASSPKKPWNLRWRVGKRTKPFSEYFHSERAAKNRASDLQSAINRGEPFDLEFGLPLSEILKVKAKQQKAASITWFDHAIEYAMYKWPRVSATGRKGIADVLRDVTMLLVPRQANRPSDNLMSKALRNWVFRPDCDLDKAPSEIREAARWVTKHSPPLSALEDAEQLRALLDGLTVRRDGKPAAANYFARRRTVLYNACGYAVAKGRLPHNPLEGRELDWEPPSDLRAEDEIVDPRSVGNTRQVEEMLTAVSYVGRNQGPRFVGFFACMYYAMARPEEVVELKRSQCELPEEGWGRLVLEGAAPTVGRDWTDSGEVHDLRGLKHRSRRATRSVPIQPRLVQLLRKHIERFGVGTGGRLFPSVRGQPIDNGTYNRVWRQARIWGLSADEQQTPRLQRPYTLRHSGISLRRTAGVPSKQVAEWAGHSVEVLERVYSKVLEGYDERWQRQIDEFMKD